MAAPEATAFASWYLSPAQHLSVLAIVLAFFFLSFLLNPLRVHNGASSAVHLVGVAGSAYYVIKVPTGSALWPILLLATTNWLMRARSHGISPPDVAGAWLKKMDEKRIMMGVASALSGASLTVLTAGWAAPARIALLASVDVARGLLTWHANQRARYAALPIFERWVGFSSCYAVGAGVAWMQERSLLQLWRRIRKLQMCTSGMLESEHCLLMMLGTEY